MVEKINKSNYLFRRFDNVKGSFANWSSGGVSSKGSATIRATPSSFIFSRFMIQPADTTA